MPGPNITVPNRPFATETITGLMLPDGVFESSLGHQRLNAHFTNLDAAPINGVSFYVEGFSDPRIQATPATYSAALPGNASALWSWDVDVSAVPAGVYDVSLVAKINAGLTRTIKKIFVMRVQFNPGTRTFTAQGPEGAIEVSFGDLIAPKSQCCPPGIDHEKLFNFLEEVTSLSIPRRPKFRPVPAGLLAAPHGRGHHPNAPIRRPIWRLPLQDFAWKLFFCIIAVVLLIAAAVDCAIQGHW